MEQTTIDNLLKAATLLVPIGAVFVGIGIERFKARSIIVNKHIEVNSIGKSLSDPNYGDIKVLYQDEPISGNLLFTTITLHNDTWTSLPKTEFKFAVLGKASILNSRSFLVFGDNTLELSFSVKFSKDFQDVLDQYKVENKPATHDANVNYINRHREYETPYFNKGQKIITELLMTREDETNQILVIPMKENVKIVDVQDESSYKKARMNNIHLMAAVIYLLSAIYLYYSDYSASQNVWLMTINSFTCYLLAWMLWFVFRFIKQLFVK